MPRITSNCSALTSLTCKSEWTSVKRSSVCVDGRMFGSCRIIFLSIHGCKIGVLLCFTPLNSKEIFQLVSKPCENCTCSSTSGSSSSEPPRHHPKQDKRRPIPSEMSNWITWILDSFNNRLGSQHLNVLAWKLQENFSWTHNSWSSLALPSIKNIH